MSALGPRDPSLACLQSRKNGRLQLAGFGLVAVPEEALDPFSHLRGNELSQYVELCTRANLEDNEIETLPANIGGLGGALAQLQLRNNKIETLPAALSDLPGLKTLSVENNRLSVIEEKLSLPHLTTLSIQNNLLKFLPDDLFDGLSVCSKLTCADNQIAALPTSLRRAKHLRVLDLSRNKLTTISGLEGATSLESIFVSQNLLEDLQGLEYLEHLTEL
jgi:Leucine-rich repeat (LRR) protein